MPEITIPYQFTPRDYQLEFLEAPQRFKIGVFHRRAGKSCMALNEQIRKTQLLKGTFYYIMPTYKQCKQVIWDTMIKRHLPNQIIKKINESELAVYYTNGNIQRFVGCEDPDKHRGISPVDVVFDEYSEMDPKIWEAVVQPVLRENRGSATFVFTPKGKNHSWKLLTNARDYPKEWFSMIRNVDDTNVITKEELEFAKRDTPQALFQQEYYCEFLEGAGAMFRRVRQNLWSGGSFADEGHNYQIGIDLAKYNDWTVITPFDLNTMKVMEQERFNQVDWNLQKARIEAIARRYNDARLVVDSTGVGDPIAEDLGRSGLAVEPFKFTETSRKMLLENLAILLEQDKIKLPNDEGLVNELESMQLKLNESGKVKAEVPNGMTDDRIMSLALAVWNAPISQSRATEKESEFKLYSYNYN